MVLTDKLSNLHLLLRVPSFSRWPLQVRFFCEDVYREWQVWNERANGSIRSGIKVLLDLKQPKEIINDGEFPMSTKAIGKRKREALGKGGIGGLDVGYSELNYHVEKSIFFIAKDETLKCAVCANNLDSKTAMTLVCPENDCSIASHMTCLATKFIEDDEAGAAVIPISGKCPGCKAELRWIDLIMELSLRSRGQKEVAQIIKKPTESKTRLPKLEKALVSQLEAQNLEVEQVADPDDGLVGVDILAPHVSDESLPDDWQYQDDDDDMLSIVSGHSTLSDGVEAESPTKRSLTATRLPAVIEDSELDDVEFSD